uniref:Disease resistance N-terminal domain-containing protein n=1 Tax=Leersia perrieri TaxID=77586 RepID=A0A0D9VEV6_9ORYZ
MTPPDHMYSGRKSDKIKCPTVKSSLLLAVKLPSHSPAPRRLATGGGFALQSSKQIQSRVGSQTNDQPSHDTSGLQRLRDTLPAMYDLIDRAEWRSHEYCVDELLPKLKDAVYDTDDLLDVFRWYEEKVALEGNASRSPFIEFYNSVIQGSFNKVNDTIERLNNISSQLVKMGLCEVQRQFHKSVRPETSSFPNEKKIFGQDQELKKVIELLGLPVIGTKVHSKRKRGNGAVDASTSILPILPIVGIGGLERQRWPNICAIINE